jgi:hypothetical protein
MHQSEYFFLQDIHHSEDAGPVDFGIHRMSCFAKHFFIKNYLVK